MVQRVGFITNKTIIQSVISRIPVSCRLITIRISAKPQNTTIVEIYSQASAYAEDLVEEFYEQPETTVKEITMRERPPHYKYKETGLLRKSGPRTMDRNIATLGSGRNH